MLQLRTAEAAVALAGLLCGMPVVACSGLHMPTGRRRPSVQPQAQRLPLRISHLPSRCFPAPCLQLPGRCGHVRLVRRRLLERREEQEVCALRRGAGALHQVRCWQACRWAGVVWQWTGVWSSAHCQQQQARTPAASSALPLSRQLLTAEHSADRCLCSPAPLVTAAPPMAWRIHPPLGRRCVTRKHCCSSSCCCCCRRRCCCRLVAEGWSALRNQRTQRACVHGSWLTPWWLAVCRTHPTALSAPFAAARRAGRWTMRPTSA